MILEEKGTTEHNCPGDVDRDTHNVPEARYPDKGKRGTLSTLTELQHCRNEEPDRDQFGCTVGFDTHYDQHRRNKPKGKCNNKEGQACLEAHFQEK